MGRGFSLYNGLALPEFRLSLSWTEDLCFQKRKKQTRRLFTKIVNLIKCTPSDGCQQKKQKAQAVPRTCVGALMTDWRRWVPERERLQAQRQRRWSEDAGNAVSGRLQRKVWAGLGTGRTAVTCVGCVFVEEVFGRALEGAGLPGGVARGREGWHKAMVLVCLDGGGGMGFCGWVWDGGAPAHVCSILPSNGAHSPAGAKQASLLVRPRP